MRIFKNKINDLFWFTSLLLTLLPFLDHNVAVQAQALCVPGSSTTAKAGWSVIFYNYNDLLWGVFTNYQDFLSDPSRYASESQQGSITGVNSLNFKVVPSILSLYYGKIYGVNILLSNFVAEYTGFFVPPTSGQYTFTFTGVDDNAALLFSSTNTFKCCANGAYDSSFTYNVALFASYNTQGTGSISTTVTLQKGLAYPIKMTYVNRFSTGIFNVAFKDPSGATHTDWTGYIASQAEVASQCPPFPMMTTTTTSQWTGTITSTTTTTTIYTGTDGKPTGGQIIIIETPPFTLPSPYLTTATTRGSTWSGVVEYYSTQSNGKPATGTTTFTIPPPVTFAPAPTTVSPTTPIPSTGCTSPPQVPNSGAFNIRLFYFNSNAYPPNSDFQYFLTYQYSNAPTYGTTSGITNINFNIRPIPIIGDWGTLYGITIQITSFVAEYTAFFVPQMTGTYTFRLVGNDDYAALFFDPS